ncbi:MAG: HAMP domain-containing sensor histidine kinase [Gemmatimonadaceae bacterium]|nr:HAMP domain-containing sensor histidine kinase [Gemmatimonadaceae bacterium]
MKQLRYRTRLIVILSLFAIVPAALLTILWSGTVSSAISLVGGRGAWESVAASGQRAIAAVRTAPLTPAQRQLVDVHQRELNASLEQARRYSFLAGRSVRIVVVIGLIALVAFGFAATRAAGHLSRQMGRPLDEIVGWTARIGRGEPLPPREAKVARGAPEFATLRERMRDMSAAIDAGRKRAAEAERLKAYRESARRVAHELKNLLTPIRFAMDRLRRDAPSELHETVEVLAIESKRLERIARAFAEFGRLPDGPSAEVDIAELVRYSAASAVPPGIDVEVNADDNLPRVMGHHDALAAALSNVILNAVDTCDGSGRIVVGATNAMLDGRPAVRIEVSDDGAGIAPDDLERIWDPYVTHKPGGTGLGLAIARQAVLAHDGTVEASSTLGEGTRIRFILPAMAGSDNGSSQNGS